eukprot:6774976-Pyramimonas_sp.AAC.1
MVVGVVAILQIVTDNKNGSGSESIRSSLMCWTKHSRPTTYEEVTIGVLVIVAVAVVAGMIQTVAAVAIVIVVVVIVVVVVVVGVAVVAVVVAQQ